MDEFHWSLTYEGVLTITLTNEDALLTMELLAQLQKMYRHPPISTRVMFLTHQGEHFCLGGKVGDPRQKSGNDYERFAEALENTFIAISDCPLPTICLLHGKTNGGGMAFLEAFDLAYCDQNSLFSIAEMENHLPPVLSFAGASLVLPSKKLMEMALLSTSITAEQAVAFGVVTDIVSNVDMEAITQSLALQNPTAITHIKKLKQMMQGTRRRTAYDWASLLLPQAIRNPHSFETLNAKDKGREPCYK